MQLLRKVPPSQQVRSPPFQNPSHVAPCPTVHRAASCRRCQVLWTDPTCGCFCVPPDDTGPKDDEDDEDDEEGTGTGTDTETETDTADFGLGR